MKYRINVTIIQIIINVICFLALSPTISLFQIARRRRTSKIFTPNEVDTEMNILISVTLLLMSHDETHSKANENPNRRLAKGQVR